MIGNRLPINGPDSFSKVSFPPAPLISDARREPYAIYRWGDGNCRANDYGTPVHDSCLDHKFDWTYALIASTWVVLKLGRQPYAIILLLECMEGDADSS